MAAISAGIVDGEARVDLPYVEDSQAEVDCNFVMTGDGRFVEVQATAEKDAFSAEQYAALVGAGRRRHADAVRPPARGAGPGAPVKVVLASRNRGKLREIVPLLAGLGFELWSRSTRSRPTASCARTATRFEANALAKARQAAAATGLPAIADDSGLEVDALGGAPGVYSARYAGLPSDDARNNAKLLEALARRSAAAPAGRGFAAWPRSSIRARASS